MRAMLWEEQSPDWSLLWWCSLSIAKARAWIAPSHRFSNRPDKMSIFLAAFLLGAVASPPPDDDDDKAPSTRPAASSTKRDADDLKPGLTPPTSPDDKPKAGATSHPASHGTGEDDEEEGLAQPSSAIVVTAHRLDTARTQIDAGLGATVYSLTNDTIENRPGGETGSVADILAQAPGVTLSGRALNVRGAPANQVRINNVIVP